MSESKVVSELRKSLQRPLTTTQKITQAYKAAESDEDRTAIREIALEEMDHSGSRDEVLALLNAAGLETYEETEDRAKVDDIVHPRVDPPTTTEAAQVGEAMRGLDTAWQAGYITSRAEYSQRMAELQKELETAEKNDAAARANYEAKIAGTFDYSQRFRPGGELNPHGEDVPTDGHASFDAEHHGIRVGVQGTETDPMRVMVPGDADLTTKLRQAGSKAEVLALIKASQGKAGLVLDDQLD